MCLAETFGWLGLFKVSKLHNGFNSSLVSQDIAPSKVKELLHIDILKEPLKITHFSPSVQLASGLN